MAGADVLGPALLVLGLALFAAAWWAYAKRRHIVDTPTSKVRSMAIGKVELSGVAVPPPGGGPLRAPFTGEACVYWEYKVEEKRTRRVKNGTQTYWAVVASDRAKAPIGLKDDTGTALVDPQEGDLPAPLESRFGSTWGRDPPEPVLRLLESKGLSHEGLFGINKTMRYTERRLPEGQALYVMGNATRREGAEGEGNAALVVERKGDAPFLVSTQGERALALQWGAAFWLLLLAGIGAAAAGAFILTGGA